MINRKYTDLDREIWVPLLRDYEISNMGRVVSNKGLYPRIMRTYLNNRGYHIIHLRINNKRIAYTVHRLVALIFLKNTDPLKTTVNHEVSKDDNRAESLSWMTQSDNSIHGVTHGLLPKGTDSHLSVLDELQVRTIKALKLELTQEKIASYFGVHRGTVGSILRGLSWKHVSV